MNKYSVFANTDKEGQSRWYHACERNRVPYIQVLNRTKLARVEWDCITVLSAQDHLIHGQEQSLQARLVEIFKAVAAERSSLFGGAYVGHMDGVLIEKAEAVADEIARLLAQTLNPTQ